MPNLDEHCALSFERYGIDGADIHHWMDEAVVVVGSSHRDFRHDVYQKIPSIFIEKYGEELSKNIMIDHIIQDSKTERGIETSEEIIHFNRTSKMINENIDENQTEILKGDDLLFSEIDLVLKRFRTRQSHRKLPKSKDKQAYNKLYYMKVTKNKIHRHMVQKNQSTLNKEV